MNKNAGEVTVADNPARYNLLRPRIIYDWFS